MALAIKNEQLQHDLASLNDRFAALMRESSSKYSGEQVAELKRQTNADYESRLSAMRTDMNSTLGAAQADTSRLKQELLVAKAGAFTTAIEVDPGSAQA